MTRIPCSLTAIPGGGRIPSRRGEERELPDDRIVTCFERRLALNYGLPSFYFPPPAITALLPMRFIAIFALWLISTLTHLTGEASEPIDFNRDIKPILSDKCYACHGPDGEQRQGSDEFRLDIEIGATVDLGGYKAIVPGSLEESELIRRIESTDPDELMPPAEHPKSLSTKEKQTLARWIQEGANWSQHWAYVPPKSPIERTGNWIDRAIRERLQRDGVEPSSEAEKHILLRRIYFDLVGLPPQPEEVEAFLSDESPNAWDEVVDRLLQSSHYGERMAIHWLDLVRYADTVGYHGDQDVSVSPFRDYVIDAFNANMPFDQFTREQLAGDLLQEPSRDQLVASGYNKLGMMSAEGGAQPKEYLAKYASDRVRTASTVWLGSTLGCAECHDHKFDPFTTKDFYRFASFFADIKERGLYAGANRDGAWGPTVDVPDENLDELLEPIDRTIAELDNAYLAEDISESLAGWEASLKEEASGWQVLVPESLAALHDTVLTAQSDHSVLASGPDGGTNTYTIQYPAMDGEIRGVRIEVLPDDSLPAKGPGRAGNGNFVISEIKLASLDGDSEPKALKLVNAKATFEQADGKNNPYEGWKAIAAIDDDKKGSTWGWAVMPEAGKTNVWIAELETPWKPEKPQPLQLKIEQNHTNLGHTVGRFRISVTSSAPAFDKRRGIPSEILAIIDTASDERTDAQRKTLASHYRGVTPKLADLRTKLDAAKKKREQTRKAHTRATLITKTVEPREMRVLPRGNWMDDSGEVVSPGVPHFLPQLEVEGRASRLDLANWLTDEQNPLTARVFVNRVWKLLFGTGLTKVLDDIGSQGEFPTHPELLDALALEFVESGWDVKHLIRLIVNSQTYRQSSLPREELAETDPYNRLLARQSRFRLDAELVRDNALCVSGLLVDEIGGRSVKPYQPPGLLRHLNFPKRTYKADDGENQYRRGVYTHWQRQFLHPAMKSFDAPAREECTAERPRSNTPLAALVMLNDPSYVEAARVFAERLLISTGASDREHVQKIFQHALSRLPSEEEIAILTELIAAQRLRYKQNPESAADLVRVGQKPVAESIDVVELASMLAATRAVFNMHEFITRN